MRQFQYIPVRQEIVHQSAPSAARPSGLHTSNTTNRVTTGARLSALSAKTQLMKSSNTDRPPSLGAYSKVLFCFGCNALVHEAGAVRHSYLLLLGSFLALPHLLHLFAWHHLFRCRGLHTVRDLCRGRKHGDEQRSKKYCQTVWVHQRRLNWLVADKFSRKGARGVQ